ncbi:MAG: hypothetical protein HOW73_35150 [Polyangiaceae bacterium]|nr:hypothetical protein [Polyangiaceae bacterium]
MIFDLVRLDQRIAAMAVALRKRRRTLFAGRYSDDDQVTFARDASTRASFEALGDLGSDPVARATRAWVGHLTIERVTSDDLVALEAARAEVDTEVEPHRSIHDLVRALFGPEREARAAAAAIRDKGAATVDAARRFAERRAEAERLLGAKPSASEDSFDPVEVALDGTDAAFASLDLSSKTWAGVVRRSVASDAGEGWPAKITARWITDTLGRGELLRGVPLDVTSLPEPLGAASFARALADVGGSWAFYDRPAQSPFCVMRTPNDDLVLRRAALFGSLILEPVFHERKLGLGRDRARHQAATIARAAIVWLRLAAMRAAAWPLLAKPLDGTFPDLSERALGRPIPRALLGAVPRLMPDARAELRAMLAALVDRDVLREQFDDDWFDNPRAHEALRHENHLPAESRPALPAEAVPRALAGRIRDLLG